MVVRSSASQTQIGSVVGALRQNLNAMQSTVTENGPYKIAARIISPNDGAAIDGRRIACGRYWSPTMTRNPNFTCEIVCGAQNSHFKHE